MLGLPHQPLCEFPADNIVAGENGETVSMRIDLNPGATASGTQAQKTESTHGVPAAVSQTKPTHLSENDTNVGKLEAAVLNSPEVRTEKVQALRSQVQSGTYRVSPAQVAGSILEQLPVRGS
jgi:flagellar biosynthesis anti-sigma factor FlgM